VSASSGLPTPRVGPGGTSGILVPPRPPARKLARRLKNRSSRFSSLTGGNSPCRGTPNTPSTPPPQPRARTHTEVRLRGNVSIFGWGGGGCGGVAIRKRGRRPAGEPAAPESSAGVKRRASVSIPYTLQYRIVLHNTFSYRISLQTSVDRTRPFSTVLWSVGTYGA
jgi:hypothetical protein